MKARGSAAFRRAVLASQAMALAGSLVFQEAAVDAATPDAARTAFVSLFLWKWRDIARACETYLGPKGFAAVLTSPPQEHAVGKAAWWMHEQPVSYRIESDLGNRPEFQEMVARCERVGVRVYASVILNHMAQGSGMGYAGTRYANTEHRYTFESLYQPADFHWNVTTEHACTDATPTAFDVRAVQDCEVVGRPDLATELPRVRDRLSRYLFDLYSLGVRGLYVTAAQNMPPADIQAILEGFRARTNNAEEMYVIQQIVDLGRGALRKEAYFLNGDVHEYLYGRIIKQAFADRNLAPLRSLGMGSSWDAGQLGPSNKTVVFVDNHDVQRGPERAEYLHAWDQTTMPNAFLLANVFMLAWPYGYPQVFSGYGFTNPDQDRPSTDVFASSTATEPTGCRFSLQPGPWTCEHAWREIGNMVAFRNASGTAEMTAWWDNGHDQIAFGRAGRAFLVINHDDGPLARSFQTGLPPGAYCDVIGGEPSDPAVAKFPCTTPPILVRGDSTADIIVPPHYAVAIHVNARAEARPTVTVTFRLLDVTTSPGESVYLVGDDPALGTWVSPLKLAKASDFAWQKTVTLPAQSHIQYKFLKIDSAGAKTWELIGKGHRLYKVPVRGKHAQTDAWNAR